MVSSFSLVFGLIIDLIQYPRPLIFADTVLMSLNMNTDNRPGYTQYRVQSMMLQPLVLDII